MSHTDDTNPSRGRPVLKRADDTCVDDANLAHLIESGRLWLFCGEYEGSKETCADLARDTHDRGIYKVFPSGSWPGGYLRD